MTTTHNLSRLLLVFLTFGCFAFTSTVRAESVRVTTSNAVAVQGSVSDSSTGAPIPYVTVQVAGTGKSTLANSDGRYRLLLERGEHELKFSHIGYYSSVARVVVSDSAVTHDAYLRQSVLVVGGITVYEKPYDPAQKIIVEAIRRKKDILEKIHDYRFDAYTKLIVWDKSKPDSAKIWLITETQLTCFWEQPDKYKEIITARRQSSNLPAEGNLVTVGEILNFNKNRIDLGRYSVVSPTAKDALDYYDYYVKDTTYIDGRKIYRLEIEPKNDAKPLFVGNISIADSTYDVVAVDVGFSKGVEFPFITNLRYGQRFAQFESEYWMPIEITLSGEVKITFPGMPSKLSFEHRASLYEYSFEKGSLKGTFDEYRIEVSEKADDFDSSAWNARQTIPLTQEEIRGYQVIDSLEKIPEPIYKRAATALLAPVALALVGGYDWFHFNRVEGPYAGVRLDLRKLVPRTELRLQGGYGFDDRRGQYLLGFRSRLWERQRLDVGFEYKRRVVHRPVAPRAWYNPTFDVLTDKYDPFDYYRERGLRAFISGKLLNQTTLGLSYADYDQNSISVSTDFSLLNKSAKHRSNPAIQDGRLREVIAEFTYDSRKLVKIKGRDETSNSAQYTLFKLGGEYTSPKFIDNDFHFGKYYLYLFRQQRTLGLGVTSMTAYAGTTSGDLPPQRYFKIISGSDVLYGETHFYTAGQEGFLGSRIFSIYLHHELGHYLFRRSGLPVVEKIPFTLGIHGGSFWTEGVASKDAQNGYHEVGFGIGNLTPFLMPLNFAVHFTWQLSRYDTHKFKFSLGLAL